MSHTGSVYSEEVVRALQQENKKLKKENKGFKALLSCECGVSIERVVEIKEENKKLKEENRDTLNYWRSKFENAKEDIKDIKEDGAKIIEQLGDELQKEYLIPLRNENKKLKEEIAHKNNKFSEWIEENKKLEEENKKLQFDYGTRGDIVKGLGDTIIELKQQLEDKDHWQQTIIGFMDYGDHWCDFDNWFSDNIDDHDKEQEWVKEWMESNNVDYEEEEVDYYVDAARKVVLKDGRTVKTIR